MKLDAKKNGKFFSRVPFSGNALGFLKKKFMLLWKN